MLLVSGYFRVLASFAAVGCSVFSPFSSIYVSFALLSSPFPFVPILFFLAMVSRAGDAVLRCFGVGLSVFTFVPELVSRPSSLDMVGRS